jgi:hypothetical protein
MRLPTQRISRGAAVVAVLATGVELDAQAARPRLKSSRVGIVQAQPGQNLAPDPVIATNGLYDVQVVNSTIASGNWRNNLGGPSGTPSCNQNPPAFFPNTVRVFDPRVLWDQYQGRFALVGIDVSNASSEGIWFAYSNGSNPLPTACGGDDWAKYRTSAAIQIGMSTGRPDFSGLGVSSTHLTYTGNVFVGTTQPIGHLYRVLNTILLVQRRVGIVDVTIPSRLPRELPQPAHCFGPMSWPLLVGIDYPSNAGLSTTLRVSAVINGAPLERLVTVAPYQIPRIDSPQCNTPILLDASDGRILNAVYRAETDSLYCAHTVAVGGANVARWYRIALNGFPGGTPTLAEQGDIAPGAGIHTLYPVVMVDKHGNVGMMYARTAAGLCPELWVTGRWAIDPPGTMRPGLRVFGIGPWTPTLGSPERFGDYFGASLDPFDGTTCVMTGEYAHQTNLWSTWIQRFEMHVLAWWNNYGTGYPGTGGFPPTIGLSSPPAIGTATSVRISNPTMTATPGALFLGVQDIPGGLPTPFGGRLWVSPAPPFLAFNLTIPAQGANVGLQIPNDPSMLEQNVFLQAILIDAGAQFGISFTDGLRLTFGLP